MNCYCSIFSLGLRALNRVSQRTHIYALLSHCEDAPTKDGSQQSLATIKPMVCLHVSACSVSVSWLCHATITAVQTATLPPASFS